MKNTRSRFGIGKPVCRIVVPLVMAWTSCGEETKVSLPSVLAELKAERAKIGAKSRNPARLDILRVEAARAGDETERKGVVAELHDADPLRQKKAASMAKDIGGRDMIRGLAGMLSDTNGWRFSEIKVSPTGEKPQSSIMYVPPSLLAIMMLAQMVEKPPVELKGKHWKDYREGEVEIWKKWWDENKANYEDEGK